MPKRSTSRAQEQLVTENEVLRARLDEAEETLRAIRSDEVDALVVSTAQGERIFTLQGAEHSYRVLIEDMNEGAITLSFDGIILYSNRRFPEMLKTTLEKIIGSAIHTWIAPDSQRNLQVLLRRDDTQTRRRGEATLLASDGTRVAGHLSVSASYTQEMQGCFCMVATDLTESKRIDAAVASARLAQELLATASQSRLALLSIIEDQKKAEETLSASESRYRLLADNMKDAVWLTDMNLQPTYVSPSLEKLLGYTLEKIQQLPLDKYLTPTSLQLAMSFFSQEMPRALADPTYIMERTLELEFYREDGTTFYLENKFSLIRDASGKPVSILGVGRDISDRKRAEEALRESKAKLEAILETLPVGVSVLDTERKISYMNPALEKIVGISREGLFKGDHQSRTYLRPDRTPMPTEEFASERALKGQRAVHNVETGIVKEDGDVVWTIVSAVPVAFPDWKVIVVTSDITDRKQAEEALLEERILLRMLMDNLPDAIYFKDSQGRFTRMSQGHARSVGLSDPAQAIGKTDFDFYTEDHARQALADEQAIMESGEPLINMEERDTHLDGRVDWVSTTKMPLRNQEGQIVGTFGISHDMTGRKLAYDKLTKAIADLERSNSELEQFAYVASHDLQEPLRMVSSYVQLLQRRYQGKLDKDADEFIAFAVDGAKRMQRLINDLLAFSRVGKHGRDFVAVSSGTVLAQALAGLDLNIEDNQARITHDPLPLVLGDPDELVQLFQNLVSNAVKFRSEAAPEVHIGAVRVKGSGQGVRPMWQFSVRDNGIGIDPQYFDRIFIIFQRLHSKESYPGTGIGLAVCKKIVERHGGRIWVESQSGQGITFFFTLPAIVKNRKKSPKTKRSDDAN